MKAKDFEESILLSNPESREHLRALARKAVLYAGLTDNFCYYCGTTRVREHLLLEHKTPLSRGGSDENTNLVSACRGCNSTKGSRTFDEFKRLMKDRTGDPNFFFYGEGIYCFTRPEELPRK